MMCFVAVIVSRNIALVLLMVQPRHRQFLRRKGFHPALVRQNYAISSSYLITENGKGPRFDVELERYNKYFFYIYN